MAAATITVKLSPKEYASYKRFLEELRVAKASKAGRPREDAAAQTVADAIGLFGPDDTQDNGRQALHYLQERKIAVTAPTPAEKEQLRRDHTELTNLIQNT